MLENLRCLKCNKTKFIEKKTFFTPKIKGEIVQVIVPAMVCKKCKHIFMSTEQMDRFRRASVDRYRENHNLLTSFQIINYRKELGMSQSEFADYLGVEEKNIKKWETYFIQDESQDKLIRLKNSDGKYI